MATAASAICLCVAIADDATGANCCMTTSYKERVVQFGAVIAAPFAVADGIDPGAHRPLIEGKKGGNIKAKEGVTNGQKRG